MDAEVPMKRKPFSLWNKYNNIHLYSLYDVKSKSGLCKNSRIITYLNEFNNLFSFKYDPRTV